MHDIVSKRPSGPAANYASVAQDVEVVIEGEFAQRYDYANIGEQVQFALKKVAAAGDFIAGWLVTRWRAANRHRDVCVTEFKSVVSRAAVWLRCEACRVEHPVEQVA
jgi:hypothetical protein